MKNIMEPVFEADFYPVSYGFRPGKSVHGAIAHFKALMLPRVGKRWKRDDKLPFQWAMEGDIKGCFDNIDHHGLIERVRRRIGDAKLTRLVLAFLKAGALAEAQFLRTDSGTPQGGILSPLLANVALSAIEEQYERHVWPRGTATRLSRIGRPSLPRTDPDAIARRAQENRANDKRRGRSVFMPIRYADDFIVLVAKNGNPLDGRVSAEQEKATLACELESQLGLSLSEEKSHSAPRAIRRPESTLRPRAWLRLRTLGRSRPLGASTFRDGMLQRRRRVTPRNRTRQRRRRSWGAGLTQPPSPNSQLPPTSAHAGIVSR